MSVHRILRLPAHIPGAAALGEEVNRREAEQESADMGEVRHASSTPQLGRRELTHGRQELEQDPEPQQHHRGYLEDEDEEKEEQREHARVRIQQSVAAQY